MTAEPTEQPHQPEFAATGSTYYATLSSVLTGLVLICTAAATKGVAFGPILADGGFFVFPLTYVIGDVLSEVYGFKAARRAVVIGFVMQAVSVLVLWLAVQLPAAPGYLNQHALAAEVSSIAGLAAAGLSGFLAGQLINAWVLVWIKRRTDDGRLWVRLLGSTVVGQFSDTLVFCAIAAPFIGFGDLRSFAVFAALSWAYKTLAVTVLMPVTYQVIAAIKRREPTYQQVAA
ncbi:MAG: queuosine precursor transporter [Mycolicibacterium sp.]|uniref:queuosine precursor transporter n=1 Tax=Mycolicibacterium sp. TaxID=2320850 RepID=UPI003D09C610